MSTRSETVSGSCVQAASWEETGHTEMSELKRNRKLWLQSQPTVSPRANHLISP